MFPSIYRSALAAFVFAALAVPLCAATPPPYYSPVAAGIDKVCSPVAGGGGTKAAVRLARLDDAGGAPGPWLRSNPDLEERSIDTAAFHGGDFVIVNEASALFTATETHRDADRQASAKTTAWCFEGGKLSRATYDLILTDKQMEYRHTQYFDSDLDVPTVDLLQVTSLDGKQTKPGPQPSASLIAIQRYHTPADLPFYDAYEAAVARKLPMLATPAP